jgi:L-fucono-1,5-lactonase
MQEPEKTKRTESLHRRTFLKTIVGAGTIGFAFPATSVDAVPAPSVPIIDTHIHLYDPTRPQGVPWPSKSETILYRRTLPDRYRRVTKGLGVVGVVEIECSPWLEDNQWVLDLAAKDTLIVGTVGHLDPGKPNFRRHVERFHRNPLFRGIRVSSSIITSQHTNADFVSDLKFLADAGLELDTISLDAGSLGSVVRLTDRIPNLRIVLDHLGILQFPPQPQPRKALETDLRELGKRPQVYVKVSEVVYRFTLPLSIQHALAAGGGEVPDDVNFYRPQLDMLWDVFGEDHLMYGSDWPVSDLSAPFTQELRIVREYFSGKGRAVEEKFFWKNSFQAYRWVKRNATQPTPGKA